MTPRGYIFRIAHSRALPLVVLGIVTVAVAAWIASGQDSELPLDPRSTQGDGTKALVEVLRELGAEVELARQVPEPGSGDSVLVLRDNTAGNSVQRLRAFAEAGGTVLVVDPGSELAPVTMPGLPFSVGLTQPPDCDVEAVAGAERVHIAGTATFEVPEGSTGCYPVGEGHWMVITPTGEGNVVVTGGPQFLTNEALAADDNAVLAAALLAPRPDAEMVVMRPELAVPGSGDQTLTDLVPIRVRLALAQLLIAFGVVVLWRARRLGKPVSEPQQVQLAGSELVTAVGNLLQHTGARARARDLIRDSIRTQLAAGLGLPLHAQDEQIAEAAAARGDLSREEVRAVLDNVDTTDDAALVTYARRAEDVRRKTLARTGATNVD